MDLSGVLLQCIKVIIFNFEGIEDFLIRMPIKNYGKGVVRLPLKLHVHTNIYMLIEMNWEHLTF